MASQLVVECNAGTLACKMVQYGLVMVRYTAEYKEATGENGIPAKGSRTSSGGTSTDDDKFMEEVAERRKKRFGGGDKK